jgi:hypothetical protein
MVPSVEVLSSVVAALTPEWTKHTRALRCLAMLAECIGGGTGSYTNQGARSIDKESVPARGLATLLAALFVEQGSPTATTTATISYSDETVVSLLILLVRSLEQLTDGDYDDGMRDEDEATTRQRPRQSKVTQVLLAMGNRISARVLGEHVGRWRWQWCEAELQHFLPADCAMLIAMLPPSSSSSS